MITIHHLSSFGGTIISKLIGTSSDIVFLNEKHPYQIRPINQKQFRPTALFDEMFGRYADEIFKKLTHAEIGGTLIEAFGKELETVESLAKKLGKQIVLRDWTHADFLLRNSRQEPELLNFIENDPRFQRDKTILTIRNPADAFLSGIRSGFLDEIDRDWNEYCKRYTNFFKIYQSRNAQIFKYENIVSEPQNFLDDVTRLTGITFPHNWQTFIENHSFSGGSGRKFDKVTVTTVRDEDREVHEELSRSEEYKKLCDTLGY